MKHYLHRFLSFFKKYPLLLFGIITLVIWLIWLWSWYYVDSNFPTGDGESYLQNRGVFGDKFGFINSLFSGLALGGIIYSIILQQRELSLQRKELQETREEFKDQNFQTTYFHLLRTHRQIIDELNITVPVLLKGLKEGKREVKGRRFFINCKTELIRITSALSEEKHEFFERELPDEDYPEFEDSYSPEEHEEMIKKDFEHATNRYTLNVYNISREEFFQYRQLSEHDRIQKLYTIFFRKYSYAIGHYFRHIYHILLFLQKCELKKIQMIKESGESDLTAKVQEVEDEFYTFAQFLKAQMETPELFTLFYNSFKYPKAKELLIKYKVLDNLHERILLQPTDNIVPEFNLYTH